ncbi:LysR family transcriptional regulator [Caballeronia calidae]|uniref:LysR family transcriptional regulator n=2 Tax=Caballeronia calidae TaxID=1777139 RepID=A0A158AA68_9BURK|nr:LysR family transcriptional regulator [Caballeronia calidae]
MGTIRITASENAADTVLWPKLAKFLPNHPEINVEVTIENRFTDIIAERYDMGIRLGDEVARDMTAVRIGSDIRIVIVGAPRYLSRHAPPKRPQDLANHACINLRLMSHGELYAWELRKGKQRLDVRVEGQLVFNGTRQILNATLAGFGLGYVPEDMARPYLAKGQLKQVLEDWCPAFPGYHLYYSSRQQSSRAMSLLIEALRYLPSGEQIR